MDHVALARDKPSLHANAPPAALIVYCVSREISLAVLKGHILIEELLWILVAQLKHVDCEAGCHPSLKVWQEKVPSEAPINQRQPT